MQMKFIIALKNTVIKSQLIYKRSLFFSVIKKGSVFIKTEPFNLVVTQTLRFVKHQCCIA